MSRLGVTAAAAGMLFAAPALAAGISPYDPAFLSPVAASHNWTGFHFGGFAGVVSGDIDATELETASGTQYNVGGAYDFSSPGFSGGVQGGFDRQWSRLVVGAGAEAGIFRLDGSTVDPSSFNGDTSTSIESDFYGALTARAGIAFNRVLVYARAGVALLNAEASTDDDCLRRRVCGAAIIAASDSGVLLGWTAGAGVEVAFDEHWSAGAEYRYYDFGDLEPSGAGGGAAAGLEFSQTVDVTAHTARLFVNYRW